MPAIDLPVRLVEDLDDERLNMQRWSHRAAAFPSDLVSGRAPNHVNLAKQNTPIDYGVKLALPLSAPQEKGPFL